MNTLNQIPADPDQEQHALEHLMEYIRISTEGPSGMSREEAMLKYVRDAMPLPTPPPKVLPCANVHAEEHKACSQSGSHACAACKLVSYCSKDCQRAHWKKHKIDCKASLGSKDWIPGWRREGRTPIFWSNESNEGAQQKRKKSLEAGEFNGGAGLWGNMPAVDLVNLKDNENDLAKDFNLAFTASGDLRHVVRTVNSLPSAYSGNLTILINDGNPFVSCRNLLLLLILGSIEDEESAVDVALHFWYSAFWPMDYRFKLMSICAEYTEHFDQGKLSYPIGKSSSVEAGYRNQEMFGELLLSYMSPEALSNEDAQAEYDRVHSAPSRQDYVHRIFACLKPSHRVAVQEYRRFGIVLPFGAANSHFNCPNASLFSLDGRWLQTDFSNPLEGWDVDEVVSRGKAHGAQPEDIYGCLYFFLSEELQSFHQRIRKFPISFKMFDVEATTLTGLIQDGSLSKFGLLQSTRFDRIDVSNILDFNYIGLEKTVTRLAPLLAETNYTAIVGYFMNWHIQQQDGRVSGAGKVAMSEATKRIMSRMKAVFDATVATYGSMEAGMLSLLQGADIGYDNSKPFSTFLRKQGLVSILQRTGLNLREAHRVVPHRLMVPINAPASKLPDFPDEESWYYHTKLTSMTWAERYVEFGRR